MKMMTVVLAALALAACDRADDRAVASQDSAGGEVIGAPVLGSFVVPLREWRVQLPMDTLPAGRYTFRVENSGVSEHALEIEGNGQKFETGDLKAGTASELTVDLRPGTYEVYCPIEQARTGEHEDRGMKETLVVRAG